MPSMPCLCFGGAFAPNRFERLNTLLVAAIARDQQAFDAAHPLPPSILASLFEREIRRF